MHLYGWPGTDDTPVKTVHDITFNNVVIEGELLASEDNPLIITNNTDDQTLVYNLYFTNTSGISAAVADKDNPSGSILLRAGDTHPWKNTQDTVYIDNIKGNHEFNYEVYPYYMIENVEYSLADGVLTADFDIKEIYSEKSIAQAGIVVNRTQFVDLSTAIKASGTKQNPGHVTLKMDVSKELESEKALFCRVFTKIDGIDEALYSPDPYKLK